MTLLSFLFLISCHFGRELLGRGKWSPRCDAPGPPKEPVGQWWLCLISAIGGGSRGKEAIVAVVGNLKRDCWHRWGRGWGMGRQAFGDKSGEQPQETGERDRGWGNGSPVGTSHSHATACRQIPGEMTRPRSPVLVSYLPAHWLSRPGSWWTRGSSHAIHTGQPLGAQSGQEKGQG